MLVTVLRETEEEISTDDKKVIIVLHITYFRIYNKFQHTYSTYIHDIWHTVLHTLSSYYAHMWTPTYIQTYIHKLKVLLAYVKYICVLYEVVPHHIHTYIHTNFKIGGNIFISFLNIKSCYLSLCMSGVGQGGMLRSSMVSFSYVGMVIVRRAGQL